MASHAECREPAADEAMPMTIQRHLPPPGAFHRSAVDQTLAALFADLAAARAADHLARSHRPAIPTTAESARLVAALRDCTAALEQHCIPVPREIRDELRLRCGLSS